MFHKPMRKEPLLQMCQAFSAAELTKFKGPSFLHPQSLVGHVPCGVRHVHERFLQLVAITDIVQLISSVCAPQVHNFVLC